MKTIILFAASMLLATNCFSQKNFNSRGAGAPGSANSNYDLYSRTIDINQKSLAFGLTEAEFNIIKEDAYSNPNFVEGNIYQDDKILKSQVPMRYNAFSDEIEIASDGTNYSALMKDPSIYVKIAKDIYVFIPYNGSNEKGGYFNIIADGKTYDLYKKTTSVFQAPVLASTSYGKDRPASFIKESKYYLMNNGTLYELPNNSSKILKVMGAKKEEVKTFVKQNNLELSNETDLSKLVVYFDSLQ